MLLAAAADPDGSDAVPAGTRVGLLLGVVAVAVLAAAAARLPVASRAGPALAVLAGLAFAVLALGARILRGPDPADLVADPAAWAAGGAGVLGLLLGAMALQRTSVVTATATMVATETLVGSLLGMVLSGDRPAPGGAGLAVAGFVLVLVGALSLARFGAPATVAAAG